MTNSNTPAGTPVNDVVARPVPDQVAKTQPVNKPVAGKKLSNVQQTKITATVIIALLIVAILAALSIMAYLKSRHA